ncbi:MAG: YkoF family thiamine/hydroxymethylpyrimidine-binding protein [Bacteroidales bacterium]
MKASVEISMYPLGRDYIPDIKDFIDRLSKNPRLIVEVNGMSSQIFGDYRDIMAALTDEIEKSFQQNGKSVFVLKIINAFLQQ